MIYEEREITSAEKKAKKTAGKFFLQEDIDPTILEVIPYEYQKRKITVELTNDEFNCLCPFSGLPDFARLSVKYVPRKKLIELKSLKYYFYSFRNVKIYNEHAVSKILEDLKKVLRPYELTVIGEFTARGGIKNRVTAQHKV
ncbi:MAG: preQ(1) synthase [Candidatus Omnitrophica bacterium]|nr:preQ(1) synthase [Candidatus Omnitrophota bacterium]MBU1523877.1 preQ(1) synthase [Candidatus Omnitrophota bacterium]MBU1809995.1 preQ(1) synthase [Candidatus Omnitrophota bacterium]MBU2436527.1 preQ(1) synthase [Candidatus Omnitrophota bacterium]MBU2504760.1 preQ(1) synthase [Candidatus Omnitrophota bacterium]